MPPGKRLKTILVKSFAPTATRAPQTPQSLIEWNFAAGTFWAHQTLMVRCQSLAGSNLANCSCVAVFAL
jgi:hypothetical protein